LKWGNDVQVNDNDARYQQDPSMAVGTGAKCKGAICLVWRGFRHKKSYEVFAARTTDGGLTWSKNEATAKDLNEDEMNPAIAVDKGCVIGVTWGGLYEEQVHRHRPRLSDLEAPRPLDRRAVSFEDARHGRSQPRRAVIAQ